MQAALRGRARERPGFTARESSDGSVLFSSAPIRPPSRTEPLTGLANRRGWDEQLARELARARRSGEPLSVALLDVDDFKAFNDAHGHQPGDRLLLEAAAAWNGQLRDVRHPLPLGRRRVRGSAARLPPTPG